MAPIVLHLVPASLYAVLGLHFWRTRWNPSTAHVTKGLESWERILLLMALILHAWGLYRDLFPNAGMRFGFGIALSLILWLALLFYWIESWFSRLDALSMIGLPIAGVGVLLAAVFPGKHELTNAGSLAFRAHFLMAMLAYSLFTLAALHALLMAFAENRLHRGRLSRTLVNLPPLMTMERLLFRLIHIAFALLTLTLFTGVVFSETLFGKALPFNHKTVFALVSWVIFAALLVGRHAYGWRGRVALRWTLSGFGALLLAYLGSQFVLEVILGRV